MQTDLDKTMDAILRRAREMGVSNGPAAEAHLDADELSLFAENLSPPQARIRQAEHLADCSLCRRELAQLIQLNADAAEEAVQVSDAIAEPAVSNEIPWYRRLMLFPNLAYVMGSLVLVFGGLLAVSVYQSNWSEISYSTADGAPERPASVTANIAQANETVNEDHDASVGIPEVSRSGNATANTANSNSSGILRQPAAEESKTANLSSADVAEARPEIADDQAKVRAYSNEPRGKDKEVEAVPAAPPRPSDDPLARDDRLRSAARVPERAAGQALPQPKNESTAEKVVSGKRFIRRQNVWYDVRYTGGPTVNVRRKSADYRRLDAGVRVIAEQLSGTAVIVTGSGKAYRISD